MDIQEIRDSEYYKDKLSDKKTKRLLKNITKKVKDTGITDEMFKKVKKLFKYIYNSDIRVKLLAASALFYFLSPFDLIPDCIPIVGYADDLAVISTVVSEVKNLVKWG